MKAAIKITALSAIGDIFPLKISIVKKTKITAVKIIAVHVAMEE